VNFTTERALVEGRLKRSRALMDKLCAEAISSAFDKKLHVAVAGREIADLRRRVAGAASDERTRIGSQILRWEKFRSELLGS
jgi:hypothetical protein